MYLLCRAYLQLIRLVGLNNLGYNTKNAFCLHYKPAFVYCLLLNLAYMAVLPYAASVTIQDLINLVPQTNLLFIILQATSFVRALNFLTTIINAWGRRGKLCHLLNQYARIFRKYHTEIFLANTLAIRNKAKQLLFMKAVTLVSRLTIYYIFLYEDLKRRPALIYVLSTLLMGTIETILIFVDCNIFMGLLASNTLLSIYLQQLRTLRRDVGLLHELERKPQANRHASKLSHAAWRTQLCVELRVLVLRQRRAQNLIKALLKIYQWQLLFALFCSLCNLIVLLYQIIVLLQDEVNFHIGFFILYVLTTAANVCNVQLLFDLCERILQQFQDMRHLLERMLMQCGGGDGGSAETLLQRSIELFLLELQHGMQLNICRMLNLNRQTGHQFNSAAVGYLIIVLQIGVELH